VSEDDLAMFEEAEDSKEVSEDVVAEEGEREGIISD